MAENQARPLAPSRIYGRSDEQLSPVRPLPHKTTSKCFVYTLIFIVFLSTVTLISSLTIFQIKPPKVKLSSATIHHLTYLTARSSASFNATIIAELTVKNNNFGQFEFKRCNVDVLYQDVVIGGGKIGRESVGVWEMKRLSLKVRVRWVGLDLNLKSDLNNGLVKMRSYGGLSGWVRVLKIVHKFTSSQMNCNTSLNFTTKAIQDLQCM
ncbi:hypothetical protein ACSBR1_041738 [Camellia fascicularis]